jgi:hypothetical protein
LWQLPLRQAGYFVVFLPTSKLPFFQKTVALYLEKKGSFVYLLIIRTKLVLIMIIIRKTPVSKGLPLFEMTSLIG